MSKSDEEEDNHQWQWHGTSAEVLQPLTTAKLRTFFDSTKLFGKFFSSEKANAKSPETPKIFGLFCFVLAKSPKLPLFRPLFYAYNNVREDESKIDIYQEKA